MTFYEVAEMASDWLQMLHALMMHAMQLDSALHQISILFGTYIYVTKARKNLGDTYLIDSFIDLQYLPEASPFLRTAP